MFENKNFLLKIISYIYDLDRFNIIMLKNNFLKIKNIYYFNIFLNKKIILNYHFHNSKYFIENWIELYEEHPETATTRIFAIESLLGLFGVQNHVEPTLKIININGETFERSCQVHF
jgi:hypothetical protein